CPDIGSLANGKEKSNVIVEKRSVVIPDADNAKSRFFCLALEELGEVDADAKLCAEKLADPHIVEKIREKLDESKIKPTERISFMVDDRKLHDSPHLMSWWQKRRRELMPPKKGELAPCLITGEITSPVTIVPPVSGLYSVGGHGRGDTLICFDKPAFCSYGQKQAANAPVSEAAMGAVKCALDHLLADAPVLSGMKFVHWYDRDVEPEDDPLLGENVFGFYFDDDDEPEAEDIEEKENSARRAADRLVESVHSGESAVPLDNGYHILLLSGAGGRVMVRRYERGRYEELLANLERWNRDLSLVNYYGTDHCKPMKLTGRFIRLLKYQKNDRKLFDRLDKELAGITPAVLTAILSGGRLPDAVAIRALAYIRSKLLSSEDGERSGFDDSPEGCACQWLKVWLIRNTERSDENLKPIYNPEHPETAYHCGAAMAVYAAIQNAAMPDVNVTVVQRYYASCIQTPALVLGRLSQLSVHHLSKLDYSHIFRELLEEVNSSIGSDIPATLDLEKQSYFALGYYQMAARIRHDRLERIDAAKNKKTQEDA
ncbi:MAG: type I-C CRISPR-associated protein Cas8c/Csd1, partial [Clostridia bacterium]|nr:type I-C CRISPR-associated protein Cas8c/Csd1 [Clostridia bacterium]